MANKSKAAIPNPSLKPLEGLVGQWKTEGSHGQMPDTVLRGQAVFEWLEGGAFLMMYSALDDPRFPSGIMVFGSDDVIPDKFFVLYFDERGVSRKLEASLHGNVLKWWREAPGFSQRYTFTISADGNTLVGKGELCTDGETWQQDLDLTYTRVE